METKTDQWETIRGSVHVVTTSRQDRERYPLARPGDHVFTLEARNAVGDVVGQRFIATSQALRDAAFNLYGVVLDKMTRKLDHAQRIV